MLICFGTACVSNITIGPTVQISNVPKKHASRGNEIMKINKGKEMGNLFRNRYTKTICFTLFLIILHASSVKRRIMINSTQFKKNQKK